MSAPIPEQIKGTFEDFPLAEILLEAVQAKLSGSFRLSNENEKAIIYFKNGEIAFAVSNLRQHRLFELLLQTGKISKETLSDFPNFTNDLELSENLIAKSLFSQIEMDDLFSQQITAILAGILLWTKGEWHFSHLSRVKDGIAFKIDLNNLLFNYVRTLSKMYIVSRFRSYEEKFLLCPTYPNNLSLLPQEGYILSRMDGLTRVEDLKKSSGLPTDEILKSLYVLWFGGFVIRKDWNSAISEHQIQDILAAKLILKKEVVNTPPETENAEPKINKELEAQKEEKNKAKNEEKQQLESYLKRVENAESYYEILNVSIKATVSEIKSSYFALAKKFHPDKYHTDSNTEVQQKVQNAFTEIARAYDTLKDDKAREVYDFKLRKYLETVREEEKKALFNSDEKDKPNEQASVDFEKGFQYLINNNYEEALPYLTRAALATPNIARYRAYYGKALSIDASQRHKAESEIQAAIKLDGGNPTFRIMLVEFFIEYNLFKRAEGELNRILNQFPGNKEAQMLLDSLKN